MEIIDNNNILNFDRMEEEEEGNSNEYDTIDIPLKIVEGLDFDYYTKNINENIFNNDLTLSFIKKHICIKPLILNQYLNNEFLKINKELLKDMIDRIDTYGILLYNNNNELITSIISGNIFDLKILRMRYPSNIRIFKYNNNDSNEVLSKQIRSKDFPIKYFYNNYLFYNDYIKLDLNGKLYLNFKTIKDCIEISKIQFVIDLQNIDINDKFLPILSKKGIESRLIE